MHAGTVQAINVRYCIAVIPAVKGTTEWKTGKNLEMKTAIPPRRFTNLSALRQRSSPTRRPSQLERSLGPKNRPSKKPKDSPIRAPTTTEMTMKMNCRTVVTPVLATKTTVSPGTIKPTKTLVSSMIANPAKRMRNTGGTLSTKSRMLVRNSFISAGVYC